MALLAEYSDKTLVRNHLAFALGHRTTLTWTPSGHFAEVFVNGEHDGFYHITEKVEDGSNRVDIGDTGFLLEIDQPDRLDPDDVSFQTPLTSSISKSPGLPIQTPSSLKCANTSTNLRLSCSVMRLQIQLMAIALMQMSIASSTGS